MKKKYKNILINVLLSLAAIIIFLFFFEIILRVTNISSDYGYPDGMYQEDTLLGYGMAPNFKGEFVKPEFRIEIATNSLGLRDREYFAKESDDYRILALGDSFTWGGYGIASNETFLKILEKRLNEKSPDTNYQVINAGVPGYGTKEEMFYLINRGYKLQPDLVILNFFVGNDFLGNIESEGLTAKDGILVKKKFKVTTAEKVRSFMLIHLHSYRLIEKKVITLFGNFIEKHIRGKIQQDGYQSELFLKAINDDIKSQIDTVKELLNNMNSYLSSNDIKFVIVVIPLKYQVDENLKELFIKNNYRVGEEVDMEFPEKIIVEWALQNDVSVIDLLPRLSALNQNNDFYWKLNPHFNVKGNEVVGSIIYAELTNNDYLITQ